MAQNNVSKGNFFSNQKTIADAIQNLDSDGNLVGDVTGDLTGNVTGNLTGVVGGECTIYSADGAIDPTDKFVILTGASATAQMTLAAGTPGQVMYVFCADSTNTCDIDVGVVTYTYTANESSIFVYNDEVNVGAGIIAGWYPIYNTAAIG